MSILQYEDLSLHFSVLFVCFHRITKVGKDLCDHLLQLSTYHQYFPTKLCPSVLLNISWTPPGTGDSTTSLGSPFQLLSTLLEEKFFRISNLNLPLRPFTLVLLLVMWEKRLFHQGIAKLILLLVVFFKVGKQTQFEVLLWGLGFSIISLCFMEEHKNHTEKQNKRLED